MKWWTANEKRTVLAVRPVDQHTVQVIRKGPFLVECAVVVDGEAVPAFDAGPAWLQASGSGRESSHLRASRSAA